METDVCIIEAVLRTYLNCLAYDGNEIRIELGPEPLDTGRRPVVWPLVQIAREQLIDEQAHRENIGLVCRT